MKTSSGVSVIELMVAVAVVSIGVLGLIVAFSGGQKSIQMSRDKTLASNIAQEKMQILEQQTYFMLVPTNNPSYLPDGTPYDTVNFPPETILEGGVAFTRYAYVQVVKEVSGVLKVLPPTTPDTGMRQITITVEWIERGQTKMLALNSVLSNPNTVEANSVFTGTVQNAATGSPIIGALVDVAENLGWRSVVNSAGGYSIQLSPGSFNLEASAAGYFSQYVYQSVGANQTVSQNFQLTAMSSGSVTGDAWVNPGIVISQIVGATNTVTGCCGTQDVEYVELFNPTTAQISIAQGTGSSSHASENFYINTQAGIATNSDIMGCGGAQCVFISSSVNAGGYFLIASFPSFVLNGQWVTADAYYNSTTPAPDVIANASCGSVQIMTNNGNIVDQACWSGNSCSGVTLNCNGAMIPTDPNCGLNTGISAPGCTDSPWEGNQLVRYSSPTYLGRGVFGSAYNSEINSLDFIYPISGNIATLGLNYNPFVSVSSTLTVVSGVPAIGAVVSANDGLSSSTTAYSVGSPPVAQFELSDVATGTWTVLITSAAYELENDTVTIPNQGSVYVFPSSTTILTSSATAGFISGQATNASGNPISLPSLIEVSPNGAGSSIYANGSTGFYLLRVSSGLINVTANPNSLNPDYVSISSIAIPVTFGEITGGVDFTLSQGGSLTGFVTRDGINGLQGVAITATDVNGITQDQEVTNATGRFTTIALATGTYSIRLPLDTTETSNPTVASAVALQGQTVFVATFTITGALGTISGNVTLGGAPISTGVLIVVTTNTLPSGPPILSSSTLTTNAYYATSSLENGTYSVQVRQNTSSTYYLYGYYETVSPTGVVSIIQKSLSGITIIEGQTVSGENLAW